MLNKINGLRKCAQIVNSLKTLSLGVKYIIPIAIYENAKTHFFPEVLKEALLGDLETRGCVLYSNFPGGALREVKEVGVTLGAPCQADISYVDHELDGATFSTETRELEYFLEELRGLKERKVLSFPYYKLHGRIHCVCLMPYQRATLIESMTKKLPEARAIADLENKAFNDGLKNLVLPYVKLTERPVRKIPKA